MQSGMEVCQAKEPETVARCVEGIGNWAKFFHQHADRAEKILDRLGHGLNKPCGISEAEPLPSGLVPLGNENLEEMRRAEARLDYALQQIERAIG